MRLLKQSTARDITVFMTDSTDHVTGKTGLTLTITASKNCAAFASISPTVTELANGFYKLALTASHTDTIGDFALHVTATGADPTDVVNQVVAFDFTTALATQASVDAIDDYVDTELAAVKTVVDAIKAKTDNLPASPANEATLTTIAGYIDTEVASILAAVDTEIGTLQTTATAIKTKTDQLTFGVTNAVNANITHVIADAVQENGSSNTNWGGAP